MACTAGSGAWEEGFGMVLMSVVLTVRTGVLSEFCLRVVCSPGGPAAVAGVHPLPSDEVVLTTLPDVEMPEVLTPRVVPTGPLLRARSEEGCGAASLGGACSTEET